MRRLSPSDFAVPAADPLRIENLNLRSALAPKSVMALDTPLGCLRSVHMINFMRHDNLHIDFKPHINFITGRNGAGKSSILVALAVGLGSNTRLSGRGTSLSDLIKDGRYEATVTISIHNGVGGYSHDRYGDTITITRRISHSSSRFDICDFQAKGSVAAVNDELTRIRAFFNIQVDNPCSVMHQDVAREFIGTSTAERKYEFFMRGTLLSRLTEEISEIARNMEKVRNSLSEKVEEKRQLDDAFLKQKRLNDIIEEAGDLLGRIHDLEDELVWAHCRTAAIAAGEAEDHFDDARRRLDEQRGLLNEKRDRFEDARREFDGHKRKMTEELQRLSSIQKEKDQLTNKLKKVRGEIGTQKSQLQQSVNREESLKLDLEGKITDRAKLERKRELAAEESHRKRQQFIAEHEDQQVTLSRQLDDVNQELSAVSSDVRELSNDGQQFTIAVREASHFLTQVGNKLRGLRNVSGNQKDSFQSQLRNERKFSFPPIGPLNRVIMLRDEQWGIACQHIIGKSLNMFVVNSHDDERLLRSIVGRDSFQIAITDFTTPRYPTQTRPPTAGAVSILDMLNFAGEQLHGRSGATVNSEDIVRNILVDIYTADRVWCIDDETIARQVAFRGDGLTTILPSGVQFKIQSGYEVRLGAIGNQCKIGVDDRAKIAQLERDEERAQHDKDHAEQQLGQLNQRLHTLKSRKAKLEGKRSELTNKLNRVNIELKNPPDEVDNYDAQIESVANRIRKLEAEIRDRQENRPVIERRIEDLQRDKRQCISEIQELSGQLTETDSFKADSDRLFAEQRIAEREFEKEKKNQAALVDKVARLSEAAENTRQTADDTLQKARKHSPDCEEKYRETTRSPQSLAVLLKEEKAKYDEAQKLHRLDFTKVRADYLKAKANVDRANKYLRELDEFLEKAGAAVAIRKEKLQQIQHSITRRAKISFLQHQKSRKYIGKLRFSHEQKAIHIFVKSRIDQEFTDVTGLSGGEKSYCLVSLLLALWEVMECPFYCIDEFDVFMDDVNRQAATTLLIKGAEGMENHQFIYLTPLSLDNVRNNENCAVFEVK